MRYDDDDEITRLLGPEHPGPSNPISEEILRPVGYYIAALDQLCDENRAGIISYESAVRLFDRYDRAMCACAGTRHAVPPAQIKPRESICAQLMAMSGKPDLREDVHNSLAQISCWNEEWLENSGLGGESDDYRIECVYSKGGPES